MKVGVPLPLAEYPGKQPSYEEVRALAREAEAAGFDSLWCFDHLLFREDGEPVEGIWECWITLSALAEATSRIQSDCSSCAPLSGIPPSLRKWR
ncbi:LLM class flavin-dependent oxidoreductase [Streptomyces sp. NPDC017673]|uniref:LLM class flavin-dependent oxidoreductase n=1 Tax=unclassified Streptomyces TaxID=2593676 RepID=UPI0037A1C4BC